MRAPSREDDERLREASDPTTSGERLRVILQQLPVRDRATVRRLEPVRLAVLRNPSLPPWLLERMLMDYHDPVACLVSWYNPAAALVMLERPHPRYEASAWRMLFWLQSGSPLPRPALMTRFPPTRTLAECLAWDAPALTAEQRAEERAFAGLVAGLLGLPWPGEP